MVSDAEFKIDTSNRAGARNFSKFLMGDFVLNKIQCELHSPNDSNRIRDADVPIVKVQSTVHPKGCPSGDDAGLTNQTSLVRFPSPLKFHVILIRSLSGSGPTIIWKCHYNISKMVL